MPEYEYEDAQGHRRRTTHRMFYSTAMVCSTCGDIMERLPPRGVRVNWNGLAPSKGELHPRIKGLIDSTPERRAAFEKEHEEHEQRTAIPG